ncbi:MAG: HD domain-containing protein [Defluviitaleaceae bacterium]|nr:HD domain-containing protein [Defluviitaleaceae bacterium]
MTTTNYNEDKAAAVLAEVLALAYGIEPETAQLIGNATALHDVGKIMIPNHIRGKPTKLTNAEFAIMKTHTIWGANILMRIPNDFGVMAREIALLHHERWDSQGYWGKNAKELPDYVQIAAISDLYTALRSPNRPYKRSWPPNEALEYIKAEAGTRFNPALVEVFLSLTDTQREECYAKT